MLGLVYVLVHLVLRSHFTDSKIADSVNVWDSSIIFFFVKKCTYCKRWLTSAGAHMCGSKEGNSLPPALSSPHRQYNILVAVVQETKWSEQDIWQVDRYTLLHPGRPLPGEEERATRNEGVGILLHPKSTDVWKRAGENWEAVSSRIISVRLQMVGQGQRKPGGGREQETSTYQCCPCIPLLQRHPLIGSRNSSKTCRVP